VRHGEFNHRCHRSLNVFTGPLRFCGFILSHPGTGPDAWGSQCPVYVVYGPPPLRLAAPTAVPTAALLHLWSRPRGEGGRRRRGRRKGPHDGCRLLVEAEQPLAPAAAAAAAAGAAAAAAAAAAAPVLLAAPTAAAAAAAIAAAAAAVSAGCVLMITRVTTSPSSANVYKSCFLLRFVLFLSCTSPISAEHIFCSKGQWGGQDDQGRRWRFTKGRMGNTKEGEGKENRM
jgi:hypothetical protein